ncbi:hypothetical protein BBK14_23580 [Parafrankia soli]|uniref:Uncharacterized protein n=1 Tax=Parafrankia soli TaxID=2599596 RepID=A0A1S1PST2_9ACTN|nr:hypothetical protein [Parafrankia soli]OHV23965.1 hypothetical protein BBK14_23580 [Parafrankia soli]
MTTLPPTGDVETIRLHDGVLTIDRSAARPAEHDHGVETRAGLRTADGHDAGRRVLLYPRRVLMRIDADKTPHRLTPADYQQVAVCFPAPRFRVAIEGLGAYRIRDYATPTPSATYTACSAYYGSPRQAWQQAQADCARLNCGDLTPDPAWYPPPTRPAPALPWTRFRRHRPARPPHTPHTGHPAPKHRLRLRLRRSG